MQVRTRYLLPAPFMRPRDAKCAIVWSAIPALRWAAPSTVSAALCWTALHDPRVKPWPWCGVDTDPGLPRSTQTLLCSRAVLRYAGCLCPLGCCQILPMVGPTRYISSFSHLQYKWHDVVSAGKQDQEMHPPCAVWLSDPCYMSRRPCHGGCGQLRVNKWEGQGPAEGLSFISCTLLWALQTTTTSSALWLCGLPSLR